MPAGSQVFISKNHIDDSGTVDWWVGVHWSGELLQSSVHNVGFLSIGANEMDVTSSLTVETEVLGEGAAHHHLHALLGEGAYGVPASVCMCVCERESV